VSVGPVAGKLLRRKVKTGSGNAERSSVVLVIVPYAFDYKGGERGRNRTYNLLIKSQLLCQLSYAPARWNKTGGTVAEYSIPQGLLLLAAVRFTLD
jgi:hypothetical protein